jgi:DNA polymerase I-like protein with 3'-5' exonuclease and polymerase domains
VYFSNITVPKTYHLIDNPKKFSWVAKVLMDSKEFSLDIETNYPTSKSMRDKVPKDYPHRVCGISFSWGREEIVRPWSPGNAAYIPLHRSDDSPFWGSRQSYAEALLKEILESPTPKVAQNGKFDVRQLANLMDICTRNLAFDTMLAHTLLDEDCATSSHALKSDFGAEGQVTKKGMSDIYLDTTASQFKGDLNQALRFYDPQMLRYSKVPLNILFPYGCADADLTLSLKYVFMPMLVEEELVALNDNLIMPLQHTLMLMEIHGVPLDLHRAREVKEEQEKIIEVSTQRIQTICQAKFNVSSTDQLGKQLFEVMGLPGKHTADGSWSTDMDFVKSLDHPVREPLLEFRRAQQIHNLYAEPALNKVVEITNQGYIGWVHPEYWMDSKTGRLKLRDPNLTTLPRPENGGITVKSMWCADDAHRMIFKDFSQIELKVIAHISGEPVWVDGFNNGYDMHAAMAKKIWNLPCEVNQVKDLYPKERSNAKAVNFGIAYGESEKSLSERLGISVDAAHKLIQEDYFGAAPVLKKWIDDTHEFVMDYGYVRNIFGRRRHLPEARTPIPAGVPGPSWENRPPCYKKDGPYPKWLGIDLKDLYSMPVDMLQDHLKSKKGGTFSSCKTCNYVKSCVINREVLRAQSTVNRALRQSVNSPIQGSAVDMASLALIQIQREIQRNGLKAAPILHIHDELVVYSHTSCVEQVSNLMDYSMTTWLAQVTQFRVPLTVDTEIVQRWSSKHDHKGA